MLLGLGLWPRVFFRRDQQAMLLFGVLLWLAIAGRMHEGYGIDIALLSSRSNRVDRLRGFGLPLDRQVDLPFDRRSRGLERAAAGDAVRCVVAVAFAAGYPDRRLAERRFMVQHADLGKMDPRSLRPESPLVGALNEMRLVGYYSDGDIAPNYELYRYTGEDLVYTIRDCKPDVLLLWSDEKHPTGWPAEWRKLLDERPELGLCRVPSDQLPASCRSPGRPEADASLVVAVRKELLPAAEPARAKARRRRPATRRSCGPA